MDVTSARALFPVMESYVYLNHSAIAPLCRPVQAAMQRIVQAQALGSVGRPEWIATVAPLKEKVARLINATPEEIAIVRNTVEGLSTVSAGLGWREGDHVVTDDIEFPANIYPWLNLEQRYGVKTTLVPHRDGKVLADDLIAACDDRTRLITVSFVQFSNGYRADLDRLGELAERRGIRLCIDAIQGLGPLTLDVRRARIDFLACGGHKWLLGPIGAGFFYVRRERQAELWPAETGHLGVFQNTEKYTEYNLAFRPTAEKFEGGVHNYLGVAGLDAALGMILEIGPEQVERAVLGLTDYLCAELERRGFRVLSHRAPAEKSGTVAFVSDRRASAELHARLTEAKVIVSLREGAIRVAPHFYNTTDDVDALLRALPRG
jgi:selenocysteine lyase/cysteine desulfurase